MTTSVTTDSQIKHLVKQIESSRGYERLLKAQLAALDTEASVDDLRADITTLELEKEELTDRVEALRSGEVKLVPLAEKEAVDKDWAEWKRKAESRKGIFMEMWAMIQDGLPEGQSKEGLWVRRMFIPLISLKGG
ncbi:MAG: hypothetical protein LQ338_003122 [Usnochroma carphineum]|nr:MAG: hypothetical protein LQ338_003122 [Usnochroma carphineum]